VDSKKCRLLPGSSSPRRWYLGTKKEAFPVFIVANPTLSAIKDLDSHCDEILTSRKAEQYGLTHDFNMTNFLNIPEGIPEYRWYYCIMKWLWEKSITSRDIIRDCQHILSVLALSKCRETCCHMNATADIEYLCSCHPKTMKCCAIDYNYHNINLNTLRLVNLHSCFASWKVLVRDEK